MTKNETFVQESDRMLRIDVDGGVWLKPGAAIAYRGNICFERLPTLEAHSLRQAALREIAPIVRAIGKGRLFCGHHGAHVQIIQLSGETINVVSQELVAFEETLHFEPQVVAHGVGVAAGGLITMRLSGQGSVAVASHGEPLTLEVMPGDPVSTDPHATIAWSGGLSPALKTDLSWRSLFRHGGHEPVQMFFEGTGRVMVQPFEDPRRISFERGAVKRLSAMLAG
jgi:uncharacterized protein (AIM24 family)